MAEDPPAMQLKYMKFVRWAMHYLGSWPHATFGDPRRNIFVRDHRFLFCFWTINTILQALYIRDNMQRLSFFEMGHNYITTLMSIICVHRISLPSTKNYKEVTHMFVTEVHLLYHRHKSEYAMKVYNSVHKICMFFHYVVHMQVILTMIMFNITPVIKNYNKGMFGSSRPENGTFEHSAYYKMPFDYEHEFLGYLFLFIFNVFLTLDVGSVYGLYDLYLSLMVFHTWGHLKILDHHLRNFPRPEMKGQEGTSHDLQKAWYTKEESIKIKELLKENINHHRLIMNFVNKTSSAFGLMLFFYYGFHQISGCILLLECSKLDAEALTEYLLLTVCMFQQLIQLSIIFELIGSRSDTLADAVYSVPWECMGKSERKTVLIFLFNVQTPISLKAGGLVPVGVQTMASIIKTTVSYFLMLRTVAAD